MDKKEESLVWRMTGYVTMQAIAFVLMWILYTPEHGNTVGFCGAIIAVIGACLITLDFQEKYWWVVVPMLLAVVLAVESSLAACITYIGYFALSMLFFAINPDCKEVMKNWVVGFFAPEKEENA